MYWGISVTYIFFFFSSRRRHTRSLCDWSSDVCSSDLGGMLPGSLTDVVHAVLSSSQARLGIHCHNDAACAVANTLAAVGAGVTHVQGTANGYGERCGNADLFAVVANLDQKLGRSVLPPGRLAELGRVSHAVAEVANINPDPH